MAASFSSSRLPNLPLRQRRPSRMVAPTSTTSNASATAALSQNSHTKLRSYSAGSPEASDTTKPSTSATPRNARIETVHTKRTERRLILNDGRLRPLFEASSTATGLPMSYSTGIVRSTPSSHSDRAFRSSFMGGGSCEESR
jgi:hypothetical protein